MYALNIISADLTRILFWIFKNAYCDALGPRVMVDAD